MDPRVLGLVSLFLAAGGCAFAVLAWRRYQRGATAGGPPSLIRAVVSPLARAMTPTGKDLDQLTSRLQYAGRHARDAMARFLEERVISLVLGAVVGVAAIGLVGGTLGMLVFLLAAAFGILSPRLRLDAMATKRRDEISANLPGSTDLLMTCVDAGLSIEQAISRVAREISRQSQVLAEELGITSRECEAGVPLAEALRRLSRRVDLDDLTGLCIVITQSYELGSPIVQTLAEYADAARKERMAMLEERAGKLSVKLILPLALFLLPAALVAMLGPAAIQVMRAMQ